MGFKRMATFLWVVFTAIGLCCAGCAKKSVVAEGYPVRYQDVDIPEYRLQDYINLLDADYEPLRCNAICHLIPHAREYGEILNPNPDGPDQKHKSVDETLYRTAIGVYDHIKIQLAGSSEACKLAALLFLSEFASTYREQQEIIDLVASIESDDARVQFEQLNVLQSVHKSPHTIDASLLKSFLDSPSWIVRAKTYLLLSQMPNGELDTRLVAEYAKNSVESEKLLILHAMAGGCGNDFFNLLQNEIRQSSSPKIRLACAARLSSVQDQEKVRGWLFAGDPKLDDPIIGGIVAGYCNIFGSRDAQLFFHELILSGQSRWLQALEAECFFEGLSKTLASGETSDTLAELEIAVSSNRALGKKWHAYQARCDSEAKEQAAREKKDEHFVTVILPKYNLLMASFLKDTETLFLSEGLNQQEINELTKDIRQVLEILKEQESVMR